MIHSLKTRVLLATGIALITMLALVALAVTESFLDTLEHSARERLAANTNVLLTAAKERNGKLVMPAQLPDERFNRVQSKVLGFIYDEHGKLLWQSPSTRGYTPPYTPEYNDHDITFDVIEGKDGERYVVYDLDLVLGNKRNSPGYSFVTIAPAADYQENFDHFLHSLAIWSAGTLVVLLLSLWLVLLWSLRPMKQLSQQLTEIEAGQRDTLDGSYPREIARLTGNLNKLLKSELHQRERYRNTLADLAHSLKTPLAVLQGARNTLHIRHESATSGELLELEDVIDEQVQRMNLIIGYHLQRAVVGNKAIVRKSIPVQPLAVKLGRTLDKVYRDKNVQLQLRIDQACLFHGEEQDLMEVLGNLMENAFKLSLQKIQISSYVQAQKSDENSTCELVIVIEDDGPGVPSERREEILQRGIRADSRSPGQGIGLAIALDIIESYQGKLEISDSPLGGAMFRISFPQ